MDVLEQHYIIYHDWPIKCYLGIELDWDYERHKVHISMILYVKESLIQFNHAVPHLPQDQTHLHIKPKYRKKVKYTEEEDSSPPLNSVKKVLAQEVFGIFLYYGHVIDITMLTALGTIATQQAAPTKNTM